MWLFVSNLLCDCSFPLFHGFLLSNQYLFRFVCFRYDERLLILINFFINQQAEARAEFAERSVQKLQKEVDRLEGMFSLALNICCSITNYLFYLSIPTTDELVHEKEKYKSISDELDQTFAELTGY